MYKITISYYDLAQCAGIDLYDIPREQRNKQQIKKDVEAILNHIGLRLTTRPYWLMEWEVTAVDGWTKPAQLLFESHWHFHSTAGYTSEEEADYHKMPVHVFVDKYLGYLQYTRPGESRTLGMRWSGDKSVIRKAEHYGI